MAIQFSDEAKVRRDIERVFERGAAIAPLIRSLYGHGEDWRARLQAIKRYYRGREKDLAQQPAHVWAFDVYEVDWLTLFTPIEAAIWGDIRAEGAVLYPQFPVGGFFVDFGSPAAKVALECDGAEFHRPDRDAERDEILGRHGWAVYRLTGSACKTPDAYPEDDNGVEHFEPGPARRLIREIAQKHAIAARWAA